MHHHEGKSKCCGFWGWLSLILVIIGGLNWGTVGIFNFNFVAAIFHAIPWLERIVYILVGLGAIGTIIACIRWCSSCKGGGCGRCERGEPHIHHEHHESGAGGPPGTGPQV